MSVTPPPLGVLIPALFAQLYRVAIGTTSEPIFLKRGEIGTRQAENREPETETGANNRNKSGGRIVNGR